MVIGLSSIIGMNNNTNLTNQENTKNNLLNTEDVSIFEDTTGLDKLKKDAENGFTPKDLLDIDNFFIPKLKSKIGAAMTFLISECAFIKCDKDNNKILTSDEYNELIKNYNFNVDSPTKDDNSTQKSGEKGNGFLKKMLDLLSLSENTSLISIPNVEEVKNAFINTLKMMINFDKNEDGKIDKKEFSSLLDEKSTEIIPEEIKYSMFSTLSSKQTSGQQDLNLEGFTKFAFSSKLAWYPDKKINTDRVLSDFSVNKDNEKENPIGRKKEAPMVI